MAEKDLTQHPSSKISVDDNGQYTFENIKVNLRQPLNMPSLMAHHAQVQNLGEYIQVSFFEFLFPVITKSTEQSELDEIAEIGMPANCVARINIPVSKFADVVKHLQGTQEQIENQSKTRK